MSFPAAVVSGEGVALELPRAGIGSRLVASVIDLILQAIALWVLAFVDLQVAGGGDTAGLTALLTAEFVLVFGGYPFVGEWLSRGRTVGKLCLGLRVVRDDGGPIGARHALVRALSSLVLEKPGITAGLTAAAGLITAVFSQQDKRIGDMLAGTFVLNERAGTNRRPLLQDWGVPPHLQTWAASLDLSRLDDRLALTLRQFVGRAPMMTVDAQWTLGEQLRAAVLAVTAPPPPPGVPTPLLLRAVLEERRRRAAPPGTSGPWPGWGATPPAGGGPAPSPPGPPPSVGGPFTPPS